MNDKAVSLLEQYEIEILQIRKGRGSILCDTKEGCLIFKEYEGNPEKLALIDEVLTRIKECSDVPVEQLIKNKEGGLFTEDLDGKKYILKTFFENRECNIKDPEECKEAVQTLAKLHHAMHFPDDSLIKEKLPDHSIDREFAKHNRELRKIWQYLKKKGQKSSFEILLLEKYPYFLSQSEQVQENWLNFKKAEDGGQISSEGRVCHGDYRYHNIIRQEKGFAVINFEKMMADDGIRDLGLFLRKLLEKNNWSVSLGDAVLEAYSKEFELSDSALTELYYRLAYPEKFWKIVNFYYNSRKVWIPEKNSEKLRVLWEQEKEKQTFLEQIFHTIP